MKFSILTVLAICTSFWYAAAAPAESAVELEEDVPPSADSIFILY
ncbi:hypothetical protein EW026_g6996 [Hermanssonia centrifuga]|uniref:Uncharacterized protein n=1 Tax=Hermanssonia centrifuga TaxID=98765 RepID=A0A4S4KAZ8_9APHY|nr:hypothetical protein EW026_g6996 [Hermanssonia centrifuga]